MLPHAIRDHESLPTMAADNSPPSTLAANPSVSDTNVALENLSLQPPNILHRSRVLPKVSTKLLNHKNANHDKNLLQEMRKHWHELKGGADKFIELFAKVDDPLLAGVPKDLSNKGITFDGLLNSTKEPPMYPVICNSFNIALDEAKANDLRVERKEESFTDSDRRLEVRKVQDEGTPNESNEENFTNISDALEQCPGKGPLASEETAETNSSSLGEALDNNPAEDLQAETPEGIHTSLHADTALDEVATEQHQAEKTKGRNYRFKDVSRTPESAQNDLKIDIAMYQERPRERDAYELNADSAEDLEAIEDVEPDQRSHLARNAWAWMTVGVEVKRKRADSAFYYGDRGKGLLRDSRVGEVAQAQLAKYAAELMVRQHRTHVFIIYIAENVARLTRWDRVGCIVSEPIDLIKEPYPLLNFVYRLGLMSDACLGYDTTAVLASELEIVELEQIEHKNSYARLRAREVLDNQRFFPIYKVKCAHPETKILGTYFIGKYISASHSPTGRGTRGYVAFKEGDKHLYFLKDYWRPGSKGVPHELTVYKQLEANKVKFVAHVDAGGDVEIGGKYQRTITQEYLTIYDERVLCRIVFLELARPLEDYDNSSALIILLYQALYAHRAAYLDAGVLHRDISVNNIMHLVDQEGDDNTNPKAILNDWDLSKCKENMNQAATQFGRSGTWAFMSAVSLQYPYRPNDLADDLESFIYVLTWCCLRFHSAEMKFNKPLWKFVADFFEESWPFDDVVEAGGACKTAAALAGDPGFTLDKDSVSPDLIALIDGLYKLLQEHYSAINWTELEKYQKKSKASPPTVASSNTPRQPAHYTNILPVAPTGSVSPPSPIHRRPDLNTHPSSNLRSLPTSSISQKSKVLDSHTHIISLFESAVASIQLRGSGTETEPLEPIMWDKSKEDHFEGLLELTVAAPKRESGNSRSSKRKSESSRGDPAKKTCTVSANDLAIVHE